MVYVSKTEQMDMALQAPAGIIIATKQAYRDSPKLGPSQALFLTPSISAAMAILNPYFDSKIERWPQQISPQAFIHPTAKIAAGVRVGAFTSIGENVKIEANAIIGPNCVIEKNARVGSSTILHSLIHIGSDCEVGSNCEIHPHCTIGSDGFGYATDQQNINHKIPQLGKVVIEDNVEIGGNCSIDRAALTETRIGSGSKLDNLVHIAHNCVIGKNALITAGFAMAGSSKIGDNFKCGGGVRIADHIEICDNVTLAGNSGATKDITEPGAYMGFPTQPWKDGLRTLASLQNIPEMRKELLEIRKKLDLNKS